MKIELLSRFDLISLDEINKTKYEKKIGREYFKWGVKSTQYKFKFDLRKPMNDRQYAFKV